MSDSLFTIDYDRMIIETDFKEYYIWSFIIENSNFTLETYNGIGNIGEIKIYPYDGDNNTLQGKISLYIKNKKCYTCDIYNESHEYNKQIYDKTSNIDLYVIFNNIGEEIDILSLSNDLKGYDIVKDSIQNNNEDLYVLNDEKKLISSSDKFYEDKIFKLDFSKTENSINYLIHASVHVSQIIKSVTNYLLVTPEKINLFGDNKSFSFTVKSLCNNSNSFYIGDKEYTNSIITSAITSDEEREYSIKISNKCDLEKTVIINYKKEDKYEPFLFIINDDNSKVENVEYEFNNNNKNSVKTYEIKSSSDWNIYSYNESFFTVIKNNNEIEIKLNLSEIDEFKENETITLSNDDNLYAYIICSNNGITKEKNCVIFSFRENDDCSWSENGNTYNVDFDENNKEFIELKIFAKYSNGDENVRWYLSNDSFTIEENGKEIQRKIFIGSKTVILRPTEKTKQETHTTYTLVFEEQETYKTITLTINYIRKEIIEEISYGHLEMTIYPEDNKEFIRDNIGSTLSFDVTPIYIKNDKSETYYFDNKNIIITSTTLHYNEGSTIKDIISTQTFDGMKYEINTDSIKNDKSITSITCSSTAIISGGTNNKELPCKTESDITASISSTILIKDIEQAYECFFEIKSQIETDKVIEDEINKTYTLDVEYDSNEKTYIYNFISELNDKWVDCNIEFEYDGKNVQDKPEWLKEVIIDKEKYELRITTLSNESYDSRNCILRINQIDGCSDYTIIINITQKSFGEITISNFDYLIVTYKWDKADLDTVTVVDSLIKIDGSEFNDTTNKYKFLNKPVGFYFGYGVNTNGNIIGDNKTGHTEVMENDIIIGHAGDNILGGTECFCLNFKSIFTKDLMDNIKQDKILKFKINLYCVWYIKKTQPSNKNINLLLEAYKGGIVKNNKNFGFICNGGELIYKNDKTLEAEVTKTSNRYENALNYKQNYDNIGYVEYDFTKNSATIKIFNKKRL